MAQLLYYQPLTPTAILFEFLPHGCPCGFATDPKNECHCTARQIAQYMSRISGPLLDRIDLEGGTADAESGFPLSPARTLRVSRGGERGLGGPPVDARLLRKMHIWGHSTVALR